MELGNTPRPSWGERVLNLGLPVAVVRLTGLSTTQADGIARQYAFFLSEEPHPTGDVTECKAYRLSEAPSLPPQTFSVNGQYEPRKIRHRGSIALTGINFAANINIGHPGRASLGVAHEFELPYPNVLENFLRILTAYMALEKGGVLLHSAGLVFDDEAYIFVGRSNAGKTTLTRKAYAQGALVLSDDMNLVLPSAHGCHAYSVPFAGEFGRTLDQRLDQMYDVAGIVLLEQGEQLSVQRVGSSRAVAGLLAGCPYVNDDEYESEALFENLCSLVERIPVCRLTSRRDDPPHAIMSAIRKVLNNG